jgi:hypothetical protein
MLRTAIVTLTIPTDVDVTDTDITDALVARLGEIYPTGSDPVEPLLLTAAVVPVDALRFLHDGVEIHTEARDEPSDQPARDAERVLDALLLSEHAAAIDPVPANGARVRLLPQHPAYARTGDAVFVVEQRSVDNTVPGEPRDIVWLALAEDVDAGLPPSRIRRRSAAAVDVVVVR